MFFSWALSGHFYLFFFEIKEKVDYELDQTRNFGSTSKVKKYNTWIFFENRHFGQESNFLAKIEKYFGFVNIESENH